MEHGDGVYVTEKNGKRYLDAMAGLWSASLGFNNARLAEAAGRQYRKLGFYHTFFLRTGDLTAELAEKLVSLSGFDGGKAYFATSGSEANETMVKLAWLYHTARGRPEKRKVIARDRAFHGSTIAAASMCGLPFMHREFGLPIQGFLHVDCPDLYRGPEPGETSQDFVDRLAADLEARILAEGPETIAAFIAEPINAGGGIVVPPDGYFPAIQSVLAKYDILLLDDEIVTGFGRTGQWFGKDTVGMRPQMMALAKGLTSSYFPMSAFVVAAEIYETLKTFNGAGNAFGHSFTNSGHPVGASDALEAIAIYEEMDVTTHVSDMGARLKSQFRDIAGRSNVVGDVRGAGLMLGIELVRDPSSKAPFPEEMKIGQKFDTIALENGLVSRCMGDTLGFAPPLIVSATETDEIARLTELSLKKLEYQVS